MPPLAPSDPATTALVTGASGFVGLNCLEHLLAAGHRVVALATGRLPGVAAEVFAALPGTLRFVSIDVRDGSALQDLIPEERVTTVIHAAAITAGEERERSQATRIVDVNVRGTQAVLDACRVAAVGRIVYVSSGAVYGAAALGDDPIDETTIPNPQTIYGITKLAGERLTKRHGEVHGADVVTARLSAVFGPWERDTGVRDFLSPLYQLALAARHGRSITVPDEDAGRNWLYARDAAAALAGLAVGPVPEHSLYNVTPSTSFALRPWVERLQAAYPGLSPSSPRHGETAELRFDVDPGRRRAPVDNTRLRAELGDWPRYPPQRAFDDYLAWLQNHPGWV